jgi:hypothetical protein
MKYEQKKKPKVFSNKLHNKGFKKRLNALRIQKKEDPRENIISFTSGVVDTNQALHGSVNPNERDQIITEISKEASRKVPSVSHSRPATGRNGNGLNSGSTNKSQFLFISRVGDGVEMGSEMGLFQDRSIHHDLKISGGGSGNNDNYLNSITHDPFNNSIGLVTPREGLFETRQVEPKGGINTLERPRINTHFFPPGVKSEKKEKECKKFHFPEVQPIMEKSESKYSKTIYHDIPELPENSEQIVKELSNKLSEKSISKKSLSKSNKGVKRRRGMRLKLNKDKINEEPEPNARRYSGIKTSNPDFNVPSILKTRKSVKKNRSVRFQEGTCFFPNGKNREATEKSFAPSGNTSNLIPSVKRGKLRPNGQIKGNHISNVNETQKKFGVQSLQPNIQRGFFDNGFQNENNFNGNKKLEKITLKKIKNPKSRDNISMKIKEERSQRTEKTRKKEKTGEKKDVLNVVGRRVLKRVKECIRGIDNLNVQIQPDEKSKKITFTITDTKDENFGLQFDFVMGNESQDFNIGDLMVSSNENTPYTPSKKIVEEKPPKQKETRKSVRLKESIEARRSRMSEKERTSTVTRKTSKRKENQEKASVIEKCSDKFVKEAKNEVREFEKYMGEKLNSGDWGRFAKTILELLYGLGIKSTEFKRMGISWRKMFKKLVVDRYFKNVKQNIYERLSKNPKIRDLLPLKSERTNLDIWGVVIDDYKLFFGDFENYFNCSENTNYPELGFFFNTLKKNVINHFDSQSQIYSAMSNLNSNLKSRRKVSTKGRQPRLPQNTPDSILLGKRHDGLFRCDDFSVVQDSLRSSRRKRAKSKFFHNNGTPNEGIFVDHEEMDELDLLKMTPSCKGNTSVNIKKNNCFNFQNTQMMMEPIEIEEGPKSRDKNDFTLNDFQMQLSTQSEGKIEKLINLVTPNMESKNKLLKNLKFFLSNMTNDLILHMVKINYLKKGKKIDEDGEGRVDEEVSDLVVQIISNILKDIESDLNSDAHLSVDFLQSFDYEIDFEVVQDFLASREALNCLQRKKNNKSRRPKRNDEKVKKVYKKIMNQFLDEFKKKYFGVKDREDPNTYTIHMGKNMPQPQTDYSYAFKPKEMELCFYAHYFGHLCSPPIQFCPERVSVEVWSKDIDPHLKKWTLTGLSDKEISTRAKMLIQIGESNSFQENRERNMEISMAKSFREYKERGSIKLKSTKTSKTTKKASKAISMLKINSFFDPTKKNFESRVFKSFTQEYFNHLLRAQNFCKKVIDYLQNKFVTDFMRDYPNEIAKKLERNRFHMLDLQKKKSKFLWNRYELLVALEYFKEKYCKRILSNEFPRTIKRDSLGLEMESYQVSPGFPGFQSKLMKYFGNADETEKADVDQPPPINPQGTFLFGQNM